MDAGVEIVAMGISAVIAAVMVVFIVINVRNFKKRNGLLGRADEMSGSVTGHISEVVKVERSNRSFRWKNEYPVVSYSVGDRNYTVKLDYAEKRAGHYSVGKSYRVCYVPSDPSCCIVDEFRKALQGGRNRSLIGIVVLAVFVFNIVFSLITQIGSLL